MAHPQIQALTQFSLSETPDGYLIEIKGDGGGILTLSTTPEQLSAIFEAMDALLSEDDALVDAVDDAA